VSFILIARPTIRVPRATSDPTAWERVKPSACCWAHSPLNRLTADSVVVVPSKNLFQAVRI
jgi:hypothetical protein